MSVKGRVSEREKIQNHTDIYFLTTDILHSSSESRSRTDRMSSLTLLILAAKSSLAFSRLSSSELELELVSWSSVFFVSFMFGTVSSFLLFELNSSLLSLFFDILVSSLPVGKPCLFMCSWYFLFRTKFLLHSLQWNTLIRKLGWPVLKICQ